MTSVIIILRLDGTLYRFEYNKQTVNNVSFYDRLFWFLFAYHLNSNELFELFKVIRLNIN